MTVNVFAISRRLVEKGVDKATADAVAEEFVDYRDENAATKSDVAAVKADVAKLESRVNVLDAKMNILTFLVSSVLLLLVADLFVR